MMEKRFLIAGGVGIAVLFLLGRSSSNSSSSFGSSGISEDKRTVYIPTSYTYYDVNTGTQTSNVENTYSTNNINTTAEGENITIDISDNLMTQPESDPVIENFGSNMNSGNTNSQINPAPKVEATKPKVEAPKPAPKPAAKPKTKVITHVVKKGDTLWAIALKYLGNGQRYKEIATQNGIKDPNKIYVGQKIKITVPA